MLFPESTTYPHIQKSEKTHPNNNVVWCFSICGVLVYAQQNIMLHDYQRQTLMCAQVKCNEWLPSGIVLTFTLHCLLWVPSVIPCHSILLSYSYISTCSTQLTCLAVTATVYCQASVRLRPKQTKRHSECCWEFIGYSHNDFSSALSCSVPYWSSCMCII